MSTHVDLGFLENCEPWKILNHYFPSKAGGKPAWLDLENIPKDLVCSSCKEPLIFLAQVYAPFEEREDCFHRTIYVFICRQENCNKENNENLVVYRSQLPRNNKFYSSDPPTESQYYNFDLNKYITLCAVCGCLGVKKCSKCKSVHYCSRTHQILDWKNGHKNKCAEGIELQTTSNASERILFPEFEIVIENEMEEQNLQENEEEAEERRNLEYKKLLNENKVGTLNDISESDLLEYFSCKEDKEFIKFKKRVDSYPDQILRYEKGGSPLWISNNKKLNITDVPNCEYCGGPRQFEFQILPQILYQLKENVLDFGILIVYTCASSCNDKFEYKKEYIYRQNVSSE